YTWYHLTLLHIHICSLNKYSNLVILHTVVWITSTKSRRSLLMNSYVQHRNSGAIVQIRIFASFQHLKRSEERRVGKEGRCRWWQHDEEENSITTSVGGH